MDGLALGVEHLDVEVGIVGPEAELAPTSHIPMAPRRTRSNGYALGFRRGSGRSRVFKDEHLETLNLDDLVRQGRD